MNEEKEKRTIQPNWYQIGGEWHHCVTNYDGEKYHTYVDGVLQPEEEPFEKEDDTALKDLANSLRQIADDHPCCKGPLQLAADALVRMGKEL